MKLKLRMIISIPPTQRADSELRMMQSILREVCPATLGPVHSDLLMTLCMSARLQRFEQNETVYLQGEDVDRFYIVLSGSVGTLRPQEHYVRECEDNLKLLVKNIELGDGVDPTEVLHCAQCNSIGQILADVFHYDVRS